MLTMLAQGSLLFLTMSMSQAKHDSIPNLEDLNKSNGVCIRDPMLMVDHSPHDRNYRTSFLRLYFLRLLECANTTDLERLLTQECLLASCEFI